MFQTCFIHGITVKELVNMLVEGLPDELIAAEIHTTALITGISKPCSTSVLYFGFGLARAERAARAGFKLKMLVIAARFSSTSSLPLAF